MAMLETLVNRPLAIAVFTIMGSVGGAMLKDKLQATGSEAANGVRISHLEEFREKHLADSVHRSEYEKLDRQAVRKAEFEQFVQAVLRDLAEIKAELRRR